MLAVLISLIMVISILPTSVYSEGDGMECYIDANGGVCTVTELRLDPEGTFDGTLPVPEAPAGCEFIGWFTTLGDPTTQVDENSYLKYVTLHAHYRIKAVSLNGFTDPAAGKTADQQTSGITVPSGAHYTLDSAHWYRYGDGGSTFSGTFTKGDTYYFSAMLEAQDGYFFIQPTGGENMTMDCSVNTSNVSVSECHGLSGNNTLAAVVLDGFNPGTYKISFDANGGTCATVTANTNASDKLAELPVPKAPAGCEFTGWYIDNGDETMSQVNKDTVYNKDTALLAGYFITSVIINGWTDPEIGQTYSDVYNISTVPEGAPYKLDFTQCVDVGETHNLNDTDKFLEGHTFSVSFHLEALKPGYVFKPGTTENKKTVSATVNSTSCGIESSCADSTNQNKAVVLLSGLKLVKYRETHIEGLALNFSSFVHGDQIVATGTLLDEDNNPVTGATVTWDMSSATATTGSDGKFRLTAFADISRNTANTGKASADYTLKISYAGETGVYGACSGTKPYSVTNTVTIIYNANTAHGGDCYLGKYQGGGDAEQKNCFACTDTVYFSDGKFADGLCFAKIAESVAFPLLGWDTDPDAVTPAYAAGASVPDDLVAPGGSLTLYAIWLEPVYLTAIDAQITEPEKGETPAGTAGFTVDPESVIIYSYELLWLKSETKSSVSTDWTYMTAGEKFEAGMWYSANVFAYITDNDHVEDDDLLPTPDPDVSQIFFVSGDVTGTVNSEAHDGIFGPVRPEAQTAYLGYCWQIPYAITAGDGQTYKLNTYRNLQFTCDGDCSRFTGIEIDGASCPASNFDVKSGSTIVTVKGSFLNTLAEGKHSVKFIYRNGESDVVYFNVEKASNPSTGDSGRPGLWLAVALASLTSAAAIIKKRYSL